VDDRILDQDPLLAQLKQLIALKFRLGNRLDGDFSDDEPLIGGRLGLDSLDALELGLQIEESFGIKFASAADSHRAFASLDHLCRCIREHVPTTPQIV
jgi:acyl carrier protein